MRIFGFWFQDRNTITFVFVVFEDNLFAFNQSFQFA
jgi:hypothetical protein